MTRAARHELLAAQTQLASALEQACAVLGGIEDDEAALPLAADVEAALLELERLMGVNGDLEGQERVLASVVLPERFGSAYAILQKLRNREVEALHPLCDWQFVGPFDNERGRGIRRTLEPEQRPGAGETYAGKVREVSWRRTPAMTPQWGHVMLTHLVRPDEQVCVIARTWVRSPSEQDALLFIGVSGELVAWVNGEGVFETRKEHEFAHDSFAVPIRLEEGWNELALKVGNQEQALMFAARIAEARSGRPLDLETTAEQPEGVDVGELGRKRPRVDPLAARPGLAAVLGAAAAEGKSDAEAHHRSALLEWMLSTKPTSEYPGREASRLATEAAPEVLRYALLRAETLNDESAAISAELDANPRLHAIDAILAIEPELPEALLWRAEHELYHKDNGFGAIALLDRALARAPGSLRLLDLRADALESEGQEALAEAVRREMLADPGVTRYPWILSGAVSVLAAGDPRMHEFQLDLARRPNFEDAAVRVDRRNRLVTGADAIESELALLERLLRDDPWDPSVRSRAAANVVQLGAPGRARELLGEAIAIAAVGGSVHKLRARAFLARGETELAIAALERALELDFSATDEERLLQHLRSLGTTAFHEPYREPLDAILARTQDEERPDGSREVLLKRLVIEVNPDGTAKRYLRMVQRVLSEQGARDLDRVPFSAQSDQDLRVLRADVRRADGTTEPARTGRGRFVYVDLPPLEPGDVVDLEWRVDDLRPTFFGNYFGLNESLTPDARLKVDESEIVLLVPRELPLYFHTRSFAGERMEDTLEDGRARITFRMRGIEPLKAEALMPGLEETAPIVQASSYASWEEFGSWWWNLIEDEIKVSPEMKEKVAELTAGLTTKEDKMRAIYDFVVTDIRYNAWEFGVRGYRPYSAPVIFSRGFGDCKDKAILMRALMSEVDIEAYPTLIRAEDRRPDEDQELALVEHFNHCIAFIPEQEGVESRFLDGTARHHPMGILPSMDDGAKVLVVTPEGVDRRTVPMPEAPANQVERVVKARFDFELGMTVELERHATGGGDPRERSRFSGGAEERREASEAMFAESFGAAVGPVELETSDLEDLSEPTRVVLRGRPERLGRPIQGGYEVPATIQPVNLLRGIASEPRRESDLLLGSPRSSIVDLTYELGEGARPRALPPAVLIESEDLYYSWRAEAVAGGVRILEELRMESNRVPPERYEAFRAQCRRVDETQARKIELEVGQ